MNSIFKIINYYNEIIRVQYFSINYIKYSKIFNKNIINFNGDSNLKINLRNPYIFN